MADKNFKVKSGLQVPSLTTAGPVTTDASGNVTSSATLPISQGGTGQTTAGNALNALLPVQGGGNINKYLQTNGTTTQWNTVLQPVYSADAPSDPLVGQVWIESDSASDSFDPNIIRRKTITATAGQTTFTTDLEFIQGYEQVYFNGMLLIRTDDYTTPSNTSVVLTAAAAAGDIVEILSITNLNSINAATTTTNTFTGDQIISGSASIGIGGSPISGRKLSLFGSFASRTDYGDFVIDGVSSSGFAQIDVTGANSIRINTNSQERMRINSNGTAIFGGITNTPYPSSPKVYINSSGNEHIGNATYGGSLVINEYSNTLNANMGIEFKTRADASGSGWRISSLANNPDFVFESRSSSATWTERLRIFSDGNLSVGTSTYIGSRLHASTTSSFSPGAGWSTWAFTVGTTTAQTSSGSGALGFGFDETNGAQIASVTPGVAWRPMKFVGSVISWGSNGNTAYNSMILDANSLLIGYSSNQNTSYKLQVNSQIFATSSTIATSDGRFKENVNPISGGLDIIDSLNPVSFSWKPHPVHNFVEGKTVGFIAQEVQEALAEKEWVSNLIKTNKTEATYDEEGNELTPEEEFLGIAEGNLIPLLVSAVKELRAELKESRAEVKELRSMLNV